MGTIFTTKDYEILKAIISRNDDKKGLCKANGTTIKEIIEKTQLSDKKVRVTLKRFEEEGFITKGAKNSKADTFILTEEGFIELKSLRTNIFGKVD